MSKFNKSTLSTDMSFADSDKQERKTFLMHFYENRLASYTKHWPFESDCGCPPETMALAGFYHCPTDTEPDLVKCATCLKELDGWEPDDDPWAEHKSHSAQCAFLKLKNPQDPTVEELLKLEMERQMNLMNKAVEQKITELEKYAKNAGEEIKKFSQLS